MDDNERELREVGALCQRLQAACGERGPDDQVVLFAVLSLLEDIIDAHATSAADRLSVIDMVYHMLRVPDTLAAQGKPVN
jgi:hypothetical protein